MTTTTRSLSALGLALLTLAGATAGFLAGSLPAARGSLDVGPIEPGQARLVTPAPDELAVANAGDRPAQLLVFDANATFQRAIPVDAGEQTRASLSLDAAIVLVPAASASVELGFPEADAEVEPIPTRTQTHRLLNASGPVDEQARLTIDERPASLTLAVDGEADDLQVRLTTRQGLALERSPADGEQLTPGNLTDGRYRAQIEAAALHGTLQLVTRTLVPDPSLQTLEAPEGVHALGTPLARVEPGQAWRVPADDLHELRLGLEEGGWADVRVYGPEDRVLQRVPLGQQGPSWRWSGNDSGPPTYEATPIDASRDTYTVYVHAARADTDATVYVLAPAEADSEPGHRLEVQTSIVSVPYPSPSGTEHERVRYPGGLVDLRVEEATGAAVDRRVTVDSASGIVLDRHDQAAGDDASVAGDEVKHVDRFGPGPLSVTVEAEAASGAVRLTLTHFTS